MSATMKKVFFISALLATLLLIVVAYNSNYLSYYNCMEQTKSNTITQKGIDHVAAICRAFIIEKAKVNQ